MVAIVLAITTSGCSLMYKKGRPNVGDPPDRYVHCTNVYGPIVIDALLATLLTVGAVAAVQNRNSDPANPDSSSTGGYVSLFLLPAAFAISGIYGFVKVDACSKHHEAWARLHPEAPNGPMSYPPQMYGSPVQSSSPPGSMPPPAPGSMPPPQPGRMPGSMPPPQPGQVPGALPPPAAPTGQGAGQPR